MPDPLNIPSNPSRNHWTSRWFIPKSSKNQSKSCANVASASGRLFGDAEAEQAVDSVDRSKALMLLGCLRTFQSLTLTFWVSLVLNDIEWYWMIVQVEEGPWISMTKLPNYRPCRGAKSRCGGNGQNVTQTRQARWDQDWSSSKCWKYSWRTVEEHTSLDKSDKWLPNKRFIRSHSPALDAKPYERWAGEQFGEQHHAGSDGIHGIRYWMCIPLQNYGYLWLTMAVIAMKGHFSWDKRIIKPSWRMHQDNQPPVGRPLARSWPTRRPPKMGWCRSLHLKQQAVWMYSRISGFWVFTPGRKAFSWETTGFMFTWGRGMAEVTRAGCRCDDFQQDADRQQMATGSLKSSTRGGGSTDSQLMPVSFQVTKADLDAHDSGSQGPRNNYKAVALRSFGSFICERKGRNILNTESHFSGATVSYLRCGSHRFNAPLVRLRSLEWRSGGSFTVQGRRWPEAAVLLDLKRNWPNSHGSYAGTSFKVQIDHAYYLKYTCYMCYVDMVAILFQMDGKGA